MANTRQSTKRARQTIKRQERNMIIRSATKTAIKKAVEAIRAKDTAKVKEVYAQAMRALDKAASKGSIPKRRASRKMSRLTRFLKQAMNQSSPKA